MCLFSMGRVNGKYLKFSHFFEKIINITKSDMTIEIKSAWSTTNKCMLVYAKAKKVFQLIRRTQQKILIIGI